VEHKLREIFLPGCMRLAPHAHRKMASAARRSHNAIELVSRHLQRLLADQIRDARVGVHPGLGSGL
jgi:hypothetical protein